ncbi:MAG: hypothetical protein GY782_02820 [Gammaproteobacteria bacterium]|nr:hypothetical protein [Gammaproteobacteria bacterium]
MIDAEIAQEIFNRNSEAVSKLELALENTDISDEEIRKCTEYYHLFHLLVIMLNPQIKIEEVFTKKGKELNDEMPKGIKNPQDKACLSYQNKSGILNSKKEDFKSLFSTPEGIMKNKHKIYNLPENIIEKINEDDFFNNEEKSEIMQSVASAKEKIKKIIRKIPM